MLDPTNTNFNEFGTALMFFGGLFVFFALLPRKAYYDAHEVYVNNPQNFVIVADFNDGYWKNGTWIPNDYYLRRGDKKYSFRKGEVTRFDYSTGRFYTHDGNYGELEGESSQENAALATGTIEYLKRWDFPFEVIGGEYEYKTIKKSWFSGWYED